MVQADDEPSPKRTDKPPVSADATPSADDSSHRGKRRASVRRPGRTRFRRKIDLGVIIGVLGILIALGQWLYPIRSEPGSSTARPGSPVDWSLGTTPSLTPTPTPSSAPPPQDAKSCPSDSVSGTVTESSRFVVFFNRCPDGRVYVYRYEVMGAQRQLSITPVIYVESMSPVEGSVGLAWQTRTGTGPRCPCRLVSGDTLRWWPDTERGTNEHVWVYVRWRAGTDEYADSPRIQLR